MTGKIVSRHEDGTPHVAIYDSMSIEDIIKTTSSITNKKVDISRDHFYHDTTKIVQEKPNIPPTGQQEFPTNSQIKSFIQKCEYRSKINDTTWNCSIGQGLFPQFPNSVTYDRCFHCVLGHLPVKHPRAHNAILEPDIPKENLLESSYANISSNLNSLIAACPERGEVTRPSSCGSCELRHCKAGKSSDDAPPGQVNLRACSICMIEAHSLQDQFPDYKDSPSLFRKAANFVKAAAGHVSNGMIRVTPEQKQARLDVCRSCLYLKTDMSCSACGCPVLTKTEWASESCPQNLWTSVNPAEPSQSS